jgi:cell division protein ZapA
MSTVTLSIGPKNYTVACADGQEAHIQALGAMIAEKYARLGSSRAPLEAQNLLFAALFLADELAEARKQAAPPAAPDQSAEVEALRATIAGLEQELAEARIAPPAPVSAPATLPQPDLFGGPDLAADLAERLEALAAQVEASAAALEAAAASA